MLSLVIYLVIGFIYGLYQLGYFVGKELEVTKEVLSGGKDSGIFSFFTLETFALMLFMFAVILWPLALLSRLFGMKDEGKLERQAAKDRLAFQAAHKSKFEYFNK